MVTESEAKTSPTGDTILLYLQRQQVVQYQLQEILKFIHLQVMVFCCINSGNDAGGGDKVSYLVVAGGGSGGSNQW